MSAAAAAPSEDEIRSKWTLHWLVWNNDHKALDRLLKEKENDPECLDPRGRTPLHLAVTLGRIKCVEVLLQHGANTLALNRHQWSVLNEVVATGNPELIGMVLQYRDQQQARARSQEIPLMLERLQSAPDFYIEMKWEFSSWIPFVSRMCPSDTYKIWKKGTCVRVDTTLIGFQQFNWLRGNLSFVFKGTARGAHVSEINHDRGTVLEEEFRIVDQDPVQTLLSQEIGVLRRLHSPIVSTVVSTDSVAFQRQKSGIWGFRSDKVEEIHGYQAKVFSATGLDIITRTRLEHLPAAEKSKHKSISPLQDFLGTAENNTFPALEQAPGSPPSSLPPTTDNSPQLSMEEYFSPPKDAKDYDAIGKEVDETSRVQRLKATVCLAEGFSLSLQEQMMPIIELMALNNAHFAKLKDFITLQMPAGFPIKFEIPLFHVMSAKVTFGNLNGHNQPAPHVSLHTEQTREEPQPTPTPSATMGDSGVKHRHSQALSDDEEAIGDHPSSQDIPNTFVEREVCTIAEECFTVPSGYRRLSRGRGMVDEEEELLQLAIRQSLMDQNGRSDGGEEDEAEQMTLTEALKDQTICASRDPELDSAMRMSLGLPPSQPPPSPVHPSSFPRQSGLEPELELVLALSQQQAEEQERAAREEDEELERVLRLSLEER